MKKATGKNKQRKTREWRKKTDNFFNFCFDCFLVFGEKKINNV